MLGLVLQLFSLFMLALFWVNKDFSLRQKLIVTLIYLAIFGARFYWPMLSGLGVTVFALTLYFVIFPSAKWR
jgi:hypothetical protein